MEEFDPEGYCIYPIIFERRDIRRAGFKSLLMGWADEMCPAQYAFVAQGPQAIWIDKIRNSEFVYLLLIYEKNHFYNPDKWL